MTATSPVRVREDDKARLESLRHEVVRVRGHKPTQEEVLGRAIEFALRHKDRFLAEVAWRSLTPGEIRRWTSRGFHLGRWSAEDIDRIVYGEGPA